MAQIHIVINCKICLLSFVFPFLFYFFIITSESKADMLNELALSTNQADLEFTFTNKADAQFTGQMGKENGRRYHGLMVERINYIDNFVLKLGNIEQGNVIAQTWKESILFPDKLERRYMVNSGLTQVREEIFVPDKKNVLLVTYQAEFNGPAHFYPQYHVWTRSDDLQDPKDYRFWWENAHQTLLLQHKKTKKTVALRASIPAKFEQTDFSIWNGLVERTYPKDADRGEGAKGSSFQPGSLFFNMEGNKEVLFSFAIADSPEQAIEESKNALDSQQNLHLAKKKRLEEVISSSGPNGQNLDLVTTGNQDFNKAMKWALLSMDSLVVEAFGKKGILAGLHWFDEYWGRDMFISLPGATLVTGNWSDARAILKTAIAFQDTDPQSATYGRIPNIARREPSAYNTADATPWFVRELYEYILTSGDKTIISESYQALKTALDAEERRMDQYGLITHGDQETWMDGARFGIVFSPRGNRAVEIQALWHTAYLAGSNIAKQIGKNTDAQRWVDRADNIRQRFREMFWNQSDQSLFDHLASDGYQDKTKRPNEIFALTSASILGDSPFRLLYPDEEQAVINNLKLSKLIVPWGIRSMSPNSEFYNKSLQGHFNQCSTYACAQTGIIKYHPYHLFGSRQNHEHPDFAYHNGTVWQWLSGPVISALVAKGQTDEAYTLTDTLVYHLLHGATLGSLAEIMDGDPSGNLKGWDKGTVSQAWSLAEFVRVFFQDYMGIIPNLPEKQLTISPEVPRALGDTGAIVPFGEQRFYITANADSSTISVRNLTRNPSSAIKLRFRLNFDRLAPKEEFRADDKYITRLNGQIVKHSIITEGGRRFLLCLVDWDGQTFIELEVKKIG